MEMAIKQIQSKIQFHRILNLFFRNNIELSKEIMP